MFTTETAEAAEAAEAADEEDIFCFALLNFWLNFWFVDWFVDWFLAFVRLPLLVVLVLFFNPINQFL
jgi:hypothetical protein